MIEHHQNEPADEENKVMAGIRKLLIGVAICLFALILLGATASRFPLNRAYLQSDLDGNGKSLTNLGSLQTSNMTLLGGGTISGLISTVTNGDSSISSVSTSGVAYLRASNITEAKQLISDNTTANVGTSAHGYAPKMSATTNTILLNWNGTPDWKTLSNILSAGANVTITQTNGIVTIASSGGGGGSVPLTNSVWVAKNGNDGTGARGDPSKAFLTLGAAKTAAAVGDTVFVMPGLYSTSASINKSNVNWHFFIGSVVSNINDSEAIFDFGVTPGGFNVTGAGEFLDNTNGFGGVIDCNDSTTIASFQFRRIWSDGNPVRVSNGQFTFEGDLMESDSNIGSQGVLRINASGGNSRLKGIHLRNNGSGATAMPVKYGAANTNLVLKDCKLTAGGSSVTIDGTGATKVKIEGTLTVNAGFNSVTVLSDTSLYTSGDLTLPGTVAAGTNSVTQSFNGSATVTNAFTLLAATNQVTFGATNDVPVDSTNIAKWISVQVSGFTNAYRLPLYE